MAVATYGGFTHTYKPAYAGATCWWKPLHKGDIIEPGALIRYSSMLGWYLLLVTKPMTVGSKGVGKNAMVLHFNGKPVWGRAGMRVTLALMGGPADVLLPG